MTQSGHQGHKTTSCRAVCKANEMFLFFDLFLSSGGIGPFRYPVVPFEIRRGPFYLGNSYRNQELSL